MLYLLDANALITAHRTWYGLNRVPEFWTWILHHAAAGRVRMPAEIYSEVEGGSDDLADWMKVAQHKSALRLVEGVDGGKLNAVLARYGSALTAADLIKIGQDPFLISAALGHANRCVVTAEVSRPTKINANRKVPDICDDLGIPWRTPVDLINDLDFTTTWNVL